MWNPIEQPWLLLIISAVLFLIVAVLRTFFFEKTRKRQFLLPVFVLILAFALDFAIPTDREQIKDVINTAVNAVINEDIAALDRTIAPDYLDSQHRSKDALLGYAERILVPPFIENIYDSILDIQISERSAQVVLLNRIIFDPQSDVAQFTNVLFVKARLYLEKQSNNKWLIKQTEILTINDNPASWQDTNYRQY